MKHLGLKSDVVNNTIRILSDIATNGVSENVCAKGFFVVITNDIHERFLRRIVPEGQEDDSYVYPAQLANPPRYNKHGGTNKLNVLHMTGAGMRFLHSDFVCAGGITAIDAQTGEIVVSCAQANKDMRVVKGTYDGVNIFTLDDQEAMGIAAQGRCLVLTCTPEKCEIAGKSGGTMRFFFQRGGKGEARAVAGVRVIEVPTKVPTSPLSAFSTGGLGPVAEEGVASVEAVEEAHPHYEYESKTGNPLYTEHALPVALQKGSQIERWQAQFHTQKPSAKRTS